MWIGKGLNEKAVLKSFDKKYNKLKVNQTILSINKIYFRPNEVGTLLGDSRKAQKILKWKPKYDIKKLAKEMLEEDYKKISYDKR
jgi:GDPmannose 4,6-dehydratase